MKCPWARAAAASACVLFTAAAAAAQTVFLGTSAPGSLDGLLPTATIFSPGDVSGVALRTPYASPVQLSIEPGVWITGNLAFPDQTGTVILSQFGAPSGTFGEGLVLDAENGEISTEGANLELSTAGQITPLAGPSLILTNGGDLRIGTPSLRPLALLAPVGIGSLGRIRFGSQAEPITPGGDIEIVARSVSLGLVLSNGGGIRGIAQGVGAAAGDVTVTADEIRLSGLIEARGGSSSWGDGPPGQPGSIRLHGPILIEGDVGLEAHDSLLTFLLLDKGEIELDGSVDAAGTKPLEQLAIRATRLIRFAGPVGALQPLDRLDLRAAAAVRFESMLIAPSVRSSEPVGRIQFLGGLGHASEIGELTIPSDEAVRQGLDVFTELRIQSADLHTEGRIQIGGERDGDVGDGRMVVASAFVPGSKSTIGGQVFVGDPGVASGELQIGFEGLQPLGGFTVEFLSRVVNTAAGTIKNEAATAMFLGGLSNAGAYVSDPADNFFSELTITETGYLMGGPGDRFIVAGSLLSTSEASVLWNTRAAELVFDAGEEGTIHRFEVGGEDRGEGSAGYGDNFAWGALRLATGELLHLVDRDVPGRALYVRDLLLADGRDQLGSLGLAEGMFLYYDRNREANAYLGGLDYLLPGGGELVATVPAPGASLLLGLGVAVAAAHRARRRG